MTYNYFNELCRSFKKRAVTEGGTAKEASCLGRRVMEKTGQRAVSKWLGESAAAYPIRGRILPALGAGTVGYGAYEATDSPFIGGAAAYGTYGMLSPRAIAKMKASSRGAASIEGNWPPGMKPQQAFDEGWTKMKPDELTSAGLNDQVMKALGRKGGLMAIVGAGEYGGPLLSEAKSMFAAGRGAAENVRAQTETPDDYLVTSEGNDDWGTNISANRNVMAMEAAGLESNTAEATAQSTTQADKVWLASDQGQWMVKQYKLPPEQRTLRIKRTPSTSSTLRESVGELRKLTKDTGEVAATVRKASEPAASAVVALGESLSDTAGAGKGMTEEMAAIRASIGQGLRKAAPVGAGALGGYILSSLLGPSVKQDETPSERERRERLQRIYNLVATTGGGALGYYLSNRFGGGGDTKTGSDVSRIGRDAARQFSY